MALSLKIALLSLVAAPGGRLKSFDTVNHKAYFTINKIRLSPTQT